MASSESMSTVFPALSLEMQRGLGAVGHDDLTAQVDTLQIHEVCGCEDSFWHEFLHRPTAAGCLGAGHENVLPDMASGTVVLDVVGGEIRFVEVGHGRQ